MREDKLYDDYRGNSLEKFGDNRTKILFSIVRTPTDKSQMIFLIDPSEEIFLIVHVDCPSVWPVSGYTSTQPTHCLRFKQEDTILHEE